MKTVVDTSTLIALLSKDERHNARASEMLGEAYRQGALLVNDVVFTELAADETFDSTTELERFLSETGIERAAPSAAALFAAGESFRTYLERRGERRQCPSCGHRTTFPCPECGRELTARQHVAADFLIGAQAERDADQLLTFDDGFYRDYFDVDVASLEG